MLSTVLYNVEQVAQASSDSLLTIMRESSLAVSLIVVMFTASWQLTLLFFLVTPLIAWVVKWSSKRMRALSKRVQNSVGLVTHVASEGIEGYQVIRLYGGQQYENEKFNAATKTNLQQELKVTVTNSVGTAFVQLLFAIPIAGTLILATMPSLAITPGSFAAIVTSMITLLRPIRRMSMVNSEIQKGVAGAESIFVIADEAVETDDGKKTLARAKGDIGFNQVSFAYQNTDKMILNHINLNVRSGETVAIVGRSGGGKSTLVSLLPRFHDVTSGSITIDGSDIRLYTLHDLRKQFAYVSQHTILFNDTVAKNIAYGFSRAIPQAEIIEAAIAANALDFIENLPQGFDTLIGENGVILSGGQRQRLAIARALLKNAPILILDEATASLDTHSEKAIQQALDAVMKNRTTIVIAHRLSTIEKADRIVVLENGEIIEEGSHTALLQQNGAYATLYRVQFAEQTTPLTV